MTTYVPTFRQLDDGIAEAVQVKVAQNAHSLGLDLSLGTLSHRITDLVLSIDSSATLTFDGDWYGRAHELATGWGGAYNLPTSVVAGVVAITSPQTSWTRNRQDAHTILEARRQYPDVAAPILADRLMDASHNGGSLLTQPRRVITNALRMVDTLDAPSSLGSGPKVRSFYSNIIDPLWSTDVTVDTHMVRAMLGDPEMEAAGEVYKRTLGSKAPQRKAAGYTDGLYPYFAQAIVDASRRLGLRPSQVQAAAWCQWRRAQGAWGGTVDRDPVYLSPSTVRAVLS